MSRIIAAIEEAVAAWSNSPGLIRAAVEAWLVGMELPQLNIGHDPEPFIHRHAIECSIPFGCGLYANRLHVKTDGKGAIYYVVTVQFHAFESMHFDLEAKRFSERVVGVSESHRDLVEAILWTIAAFLEREAAAMADAAEGNPIEEE